jgi:hypothetical protein
LAGAIVLSLLVALTGCSFFDQSTPVPTRSDLVGAWVHHGPRQAQATLTFSADGTFTMRSIPAQVFNTDSGTHTSPVKLDWGNLVDFAGTWSIGTQRWGTDPTLELFPSKGDSSLAYGTKLGVNGTGASMRIYSYLGDPDNLQGFDFKKSTG